MKKKLGIILAAVLALSLMAVPALAYFPGAPTDDWQFHRGNGTIVWSTATAYAGDWSVRMVSNPPSSTEAYIKTAITKTVDIASGSFWYYQVPGSSPVIPHIDIWIDTDDDGVDDQWLLGIGSNAGAPSTWEQILFVDMTWYDAMGTRQAGAYASFTDAMANWNETGDDVIGIGIAVGSSASWAQGIIQTFYVDDLVVNTVTYALEPGTTGSVGLFIDIPHRLRLSRSLQPTSTSAPSCREITLGSL